MVPTCCSKLVRLLFSPEFIAPCTDVSLLTLACLCLGTTVKIIGRKMYFALLGERFLVGSLILVKHLFVNGSQQANGIAATFDINDDGDDDDVTHMERLHCSLLHLVCSGMRHKNFQCWKSYLYSSLSLGRRWSRWRQFGWRCTTKLCSRCARVTTTSNTSYGKNLIWPPLPYIYVRPTANGFAALFPCSFNKKTFLILTAAAWKSCHNETHIKMHQGIISHYIIPIHHLHWMNTLKYILTYFIKCNVLVTSFNLKTPQIYAFT